MKRIIGIIALFIAFVSLHRVVAWQQLHPGEGEVPHFDMKTTMQNITEVKSIFDLNDFYISTQMIQYNFYTIKNMASAGEGESYIVYKWTWNTSPTANSVQVKDVASNSIGSFIAEEKTKYKVPDTGNNFINAFVKIVNTMIDLVTGIYYGLGIFGGICLFGVNMGVSLIEAVVGMAIILVRLIFAF